MTVRALTAADWPQVEPLYRELTRGPGIGGAESFATVLGHTGTCVLGQDVDGRILAMLTLHLLPNVTYGGRPYGLVENVVTAGVARGRGHGRAVMQAAIDAAWAAGAYKIMLLTGQARGARGFYEAMGFDADHKWGMTLRRIRPDISGPT